MKLKMHLGFVIALFMFLGTYIEHNTTPNQQILIQFSDHQITSAEANSTVETLTSQLKELGVEKIRIGHFSNGQLKITYYSEEDVVSIQKVLLEIDNISLGYTSESESSDPLNSNKEDLVKLNVSEIQNKTNNSWDFEGTEVAELNHKSDRYYFPKLKTNRSQENIVDQSLHLQSKLIVTNTFSFTKEKFAYQIPEVRAGPIL